MLWCIISTLPETETEYPPMLPLILLLYLKNFLSWKSIIFSYCSNCSWYVDNLLPSCTVTNTTMLLLSWRLLFQLSRWAGETWPRWQRSVLGVFMSVSTTIRSVVVPAGLPLKRKRKRKETSEHNKARKYHLRKCNELHLNIYKKLYPMPEISRGNLQIFKPITFLTVVQ